MTRNTNRPQSGSRNSKEDRDRSLSKAQRDTDKSIEALKKAAERPQSAPEINLTVNVPKTKSDAPERRTDAVKVIMMILAAIGAIAEAIRAYLK